jgi:hypothetical protein
MSAQGSPVVARWSKPNGATLVLHENGDLMARLATSRAPVRIRSRHAGYARRTRWTLESAQKRADEYGFTREEH